ncbi:RNA recognition motif protein (macronuclear) [Tetrahymena thermophila SB210]|uniref:RNA recognition motif protein n=1 Tax=Tetrahymena thermophila (strain SB210) TaxID=312017 RepID=Q22F21_TETTS|nr:RNA recognition motif protein [Tetrahymena thermophila SB210]EAR83854.2 RNA recognition motif protein [Tetrahymena thermophila SB210]|eukprot:XP_001031517.2 RNA recognition motif protein [Tetrahymena thermophila SB210]
MKMFLRQGIQLFINKGQLIFKNQYKMSSSANLLQNNILKDINYNKTQKQNNELNEQANQQKHISEVEKHNSVQNTHKNMVYCHALPNDWNEQKLMQYFDPSGKNISEIKLLKNRIGGYTGRALIKFNNSKICDDYLKKYSDSFIETTDILQRIIMKPFELKTKKTRLQFDRSMKEVYLANLPFDATSEEIFALAQDFGEVIYVDMPLAINGQTNKGYCIVKFSKAEEASKFQRYFDEETLYGRKIRAQIQHYEFDTQKKRNQRLSNKLVKEDQSIKNANLKANKDLYNNLMNENE